GDNAVVITYTVLTTDSPIELDVPPLLALRGMHELTYQWSGRLNAELINNDPRQLRIPPTPRTPETFLAHNGRFASQPTWYLSTVYRREVERGYSGTEDLWMPGALKWTLAAGQTAHVICSTDPI